MAQLSLIEYATLPSPSTLALNPSAPSPPLRSDALDNSKAGLIEKSLDFALGASGATEHRTIFSRKEGRDMLRTILRAYAIRNGEVSYFRTLSFVAARLLLSMDPVTAFWVLAYLVEQLFPGYFEESMVGLRRDLLVIQQVMKKRMKPLETHLKSLGLEAGSIMLPWLQGLCVANLPNNTAFRIIDIMLAEPPAAPLIVALVALEAYSRRRRLGHPYTSLPPSPRPRLQSW